MPAPGAMPCSFRSPTGGRTAWPFGSACLPIRVAPSTVGQPSPPIQVTIRSAGRKASLGLSRRKARASHLPSRGALSSGSGRMTCPRWPVGVSFGVAPASTLRRRVETLEAGTAARYEAGIRTCKIWRFKGVLDCAAGWSRVERIIARAAIIPMTADGLGTAEIMRRAGVPAASFRNAGARRGLPGAHGPDSQGDGRWSKERRQGGWRSCGRCGRTRSKRSRPGWAGSALVD